MDSLLYKSKCAEKAGNYAEMVSCLKHRIRSQSHDSAFNDEAKSLFAIAYKNYASQLRYAWKIVQKIMNYEKEHKHKEAYCFVTEYAAEIEKKITTLCMEVDEIIQPLIESSKNPSSLAFWLKIKADFKRYLAEMPTDRNQHEIIEAADTYEEALKTGLPNTDPLYLAIQLNLAIFYYDVLCDTPKAIRLAQDALNNAQTVYKIPEQQPNVVNLIQENLKIWVN